MPSTTPLPDWEQVLAAAAHLQRILPDAVLAGGTAAAIHVGHRLSTDADHVLTDLMRSARLCDHSMRSIRNPMANPMPYDLEDTNLAEH